MAAASLTINGGTIAAAQVLIDQSTLTMNGGTMTATTWAGLCWDDNTACTANLHGSAAITSTQIYLANYVSGATLNLTMDGTSSIASTTGAFYVGGGYTGASAITTNVTMGGTSSMSATTTSGLGVFDFDTAATAAGASTGTLTMRNNSSIVINGNTQVNFACNGLNNSTTIEMDDNASITSTGGSSLSIGGGGRGSDAGHAVLTMNNNATITTTIGATNLGYGLGGSITLAMHDNSLFDAGSPSDDSYLNIGCSGGTGGSKPIASATVTMTDNARIEFESGGADSVMYMGVAGSVTLTMSGNSKIESVLKSIGIASGTYVPSTATVLMTGASSIVGNSGLNIATIGTTPAAARPRTSSPRPTSRWERREARTRPP